MPFVIYNKETTLFARIGRKRRVADNFKTERAAKAAMTRFSLSTDEYAIADKGEFHKHIEKRVIKKNLLNDQGGHFSDGVNTPACCDPSTETYWSM